MFYIFILDSNYLPSYRVYLAEAGRKKWFLWNFFLPKKAYRP